MFHVKQLANFPLLLTDFWSLETLPYDPTLISKVASTLTAPWELLKTETMNQLLEATHQRPQQYRLTTSGLIVTDFLVHDGNVLTGKIEVIGTGATAKGELKCRLDGRELPGASYIQAGVYIAPKTALSLGRSCFLQSGSYFEGNNALGDYCEVRQGAFVRGQVLAGKSCILGHTSEFKNVILHDHAKAPHFAYVGDSILGAHVNLGAGTKVSNLKITGSEIQIPYQGKQYATGMRKLGAILGDKVETGCNSVLNPGVILARGCCVYPAIAVRCGIYPPEQWIKAAKGIKVAAEKS